MIYKKQDGRKKTNRKREWDWKRNVKMAGEFLKSEIFEY
jgi:hypothetical protein